MSSERRYTEREVLHRVRVAVMAFGALWALGTIIVILAFRVVGVLP